MPQTKPKQRSMSGVIRERLAFIEAKLAMGYTQASIVDKLAQEGYMISVANLRTELSRARKQAKSSPKQPQNRPNPPRQGVGITGTETQCDIAKQLNSFKLEDLIKGSNGK